MGFKDYRKFGKKEHQNQNEEVNQNKEENNENVDVTVIEQTEDVELKAEITTKGIVTANKLNIRKEASKDAEVLTIVSRGTGLGVNLTNSTDEFYCVNVIVNAELVTGYAMKEFVEIN